MADDFSSLVQAGTPKANPISGLAEGIQTGNDWAIKKANVDLTVQRLQEEKRSHDLMRDEFDFKVGDQKSKDWLDWAGLDEGPWKKAKEQMLRDKYQKANSPYSDEYMAVGHDPAIRDRVADILSQIDKQMSVSSNPEVYKRAIGALGGGMGGELVLKKMEQVPQMLKLQEMMAQFKTRQDNTNQRFTIKDYETDTRPLTFGLDTAAKALDLIKKTEDTTLPEEKRIAYTTQVRGVIGNEIARLATQKSNYGEGTAANMQIDSYISRLKEEFNKIDDKPGSILSPENVNQERNILTDLVKENQGALDRVGSIKYAGAVSGQEDKILKIHSQLQSQYGNKFGFWEGQGLSTPKGNQIGYKAKDVDKPPAGEDKTPPPPKVAPDRVQMLVDGYKNESGNPANQKTIMSRAKEEMNPEDFKKFLQLINAKGNK